MINIKELPNPELVMDLYKKYYIEDATLRWTALSRPFASVQTEEVQASSSTAGTSYPVYYGHEPYPQISETTDTNSDLTDFLDDPPPSSYEGSTATGSISGYNTDDSSGAGATGSITASNTDGAAATGSITAYTDSGLSSGSGGSGGEGTGSGSNMDPSQFYDIITNLTVTEHDNSMSIIQDFNSGTTSTSDGDAAAGSLSRYYIGTSDGSAATWSISG